MVIKSLEEMFDPKLNYYKHTLEFLNKLYNKIHEGNYIATPDFKNQKVYLRPINYKIKA